MVNNHGIIIHKTAHKKGRRHDYDIYKNNHPLVPKDVVNVFDLGYLGSREGLARATVIYPYIERKENLQLSYDHKEYNKNHSKKEL